MLHHYITGNCLDHTMRKILICGNINHGYEYVYLHPTFGGNNNIIEKPIVCCLDRKIPINGVKSQNDNKRCPKNVILLKSAGFAKFPWRWKLLNGFILFERRHHKAKIRPYNVEVQRTHKMVWCIRF